MEESQRTRRKDVQCQDKENAVCTVRDRLTFFAARFSILRVPGFVAMAKPLNRLCGPAQTTHCQRGVTTRVWSRAVVLLLRNTFYCDWGILRPRDTESALALHLDCATVTVRSCCALEHPQLRRCRAQELPAARQHVSMCSQCR